MAILNLNQKDKRVELKGFEIDNPLTFEYFNSLPQDSRDDALLRALYIGVLALKEDRLSAFLSKTANELGTELESLKMIFDMKQEIFFKTAVKGLAAEEDIAAHLEEFVKSRKYKDSVELTGNTAGKINKNKTGDLVAKVDGKDDNKIIIECKFDKQIKLGSIEGKDIFGRKSDTVWSQLLESNANRDGKVSIIVMDVALVDRSISAIVEKVGFIPSIGFIAIIDSQSGDYSSLSIAYSLARNIVVNAVISEIDQKFLQSIISRIIKDLDKMIKMDDLIDSAIGNIEKLRETLLQSQSSMSFTLEYLNKFQESGSLTKEDMFDYYMGLEAKENYSNRLKGFIQKL